jgi:hypothetical protein
MSHFLSRSLIALLPLLPSMAAAAANDAQRWKFGITAP